MTRLLHRPRPDEALIPVAVRAARTAAPVRPEPGIADEVLFDLRADDARDTSFAAARALLAVPMREPADPLPISALLARAEEVLAARHREQQVLFVEAMRRRDSIAAAAWVDEAAGAVMAEDCAAVLDAVAARPELRHRHALLMALAPIAAQLKGLVA